MIKVLGAGTFAAEELVSLSVPPQWRKATRNMIMATTSIERALQQVTGLNVEHNDLVALVLGSCSGELEATGEFLSTWAKLGMARPVLFQNSLHNASTGFAAIQYKMVGPSFTVSADERTPQECIELARALLVESQARVCIVTLVEGHKVFADALGLSGVLEGACTLVVSCEPHITDLGLTVRADLASPLSYLANPTQRPLIDIQAGGLFSYVRELEKSL